MKDSTGPIRRIGRFTQEEIEEIVGYRMGSSPRVGFGEKCALLVIDMCRDVVAKHADCKAAAGHIRILLDAARKAGLPIFFTRGGRHLHTNSFAPLTAAQKGVFSVKSGHLYEGDTLTEEGYEIAPEISPQPGEVVINKHRPSAFTGTYLVPLLTWHRVDTLIIAGMSSTGCHYASVIDAFAFNYRVIVPEECCAMGSEGDRILHYISLLQMDKHNGDVLPSSVVVECLEALAKGN